jgi:hypothetical protein
MTDVTLRAIVPIFTAGEQNGIVTSTMNSMMPTILDISNFADAIQMHHHVLLGDEWITTIWTLTFIGLHGAIVVRHVVRALKHVTGNVSEFTMLTVLVALNGLTMKSVAVLPKSMSAHAMLTFVLKFLPINGRIGQLVPPRVKTMVKTWLNEHAPELATSMTMMKIAFIPPAK